MTVYDDDSSSVPVEATFASIDSVSVAFNKRKERVSTRDQRAEGRLWPVVLALVVLVVLGSATGWLFLSQASLDKKDLRSDRDQASQPSRIPRSVNDLDQRQQLFSRLLVLQVDRSWFFKLVDSSLKNRISKSNGDLHSDYMEDALLEKDWTEQAERWLARIEQLSPVIRAQLGRFDDEDWQYTSQMLQQQGVHPQVVKYMVSAAAKKLLSENIQGQEPSGPIRQLWIAAAVSRLSEVDMIRVVPTSLKRKAASVLIPAGGACLVLLPKNSPDYATLLRINGTPLMQMMVFGGEGSVEKKFDPLRAVTLDAEKNSSLQVLVTNEGLSPGLLKISSLVDRKRDP